MGGEDAEVGPPYGDGEPLSPEQSPPKRQRAVLDSDDEDAWWQPVYGMLIVRVTCWHGEIRNLPMHGLTSRRHTSILTDFRQAGIFSGNGYIFGGFAHVDSDPSFDKSHIFLVGNPSWRIRVKPSIHFIQRILGHFQAWYSHMRPVLRDLNPKEYHRPLQRPTGDKVRSCGWGWGLSWMWEPC